MESPLRIAQFPLAQIPPILLEQVKGHLFQEAYADFPGQSDFQPSLAIYLIIMPCIRDKPEVLSLAICTTFLPSPPREQTPPVWTPLPRTYLMPGTEKAECESAGFPRGERQHVGHKMVLGNTQDAFMSRHSVKLLNDIL